MTIFGKKEERYFLMQQMDGGFKHQYKKLYVINIVG